MNAPEREDTLTRELLEEIDRRSDLTQRHLARRLGVALGLANAYLRRCVRKGYVKIQQAPANRYLYYLTPKGFAEKSRLTARYLHSSLDFYRQASASCDRALAACARQGWRRVFLAGVSELGEIASLRAAERDLMIVGTFDPDADRNRFVGKPVWFVLDHRLMRTFDVALLTDLAAPQARLSELIEALGRARVLVPDLLPVRLPHPAAEGLTGP